MKKQLKTLLILSMSIAALATSCQENKPDVEPTPPVAETLDLGDGSDSFEVKADMTLKYPNTYNLKGFVYVTAGATLTIEPGVIIKGEKESKGTLIVERGGKIMAQGSKDRPIVMTSAADAGKRKPGDWGGLIMLGKAPNNAGEMTIEGGVRSKHGGSDAADNSGVLSYVRVEFAGIEYSVDNEINGITLGSVGSGTKIDHVQVSCSGDDSFEWFGGTVNASHLVSLSSWDDDYDTDNGFNGNIQFAVVLRNPNVADKSSSNGFESDNNKDGSTIAHRTRPVFANVTLVGPVSNPASYTDNGKAEGSATGVFQSGVQIRRSSQCNLYNSVIAGFPIGLIIENDKSGSDSQESATNGALNVSGSVMAGCIKNFQDKGANKAPVDNGTPSTFVSAYWATASLANATPLATVAELKLQGDPFKLTAPNMCPASGSPLVSGALWTASAVSGSFFVKTAYRGAFAATETASDNWMSGWANFDPQNTVY